MKANTPQHKQYLIDRISDLELFIDKVINTIYERRDTVTESALVIYYGIIDRNKKTISDFKQLLQDQYNHTR